MSWWTTDVINRWLAVYLLLVGVIGLLGVARGLRLPEGQCGHPTIRGGLCRRPRAPGREHCGIPSHRPDWKSRTTAGCLATALVGALILAFHPLPRHDLTSAPPMVLPPVASYTPPTIPTDTTPTSSASSMPAATITAPAINPTSTGSAAAGGSARASGPADVGDYSADDATAGGTAPRSPATKVPTVLVPDMVGRDGASARRRAEATDLPVVVTEQAVTDAAQDGVVIEQSPVGGTRGREGDTIRLVVGRYTAPVVKPSSMASARVTTAPVTTAPEASTPARLEPSASASRS